MATIKSQAVSKRRTELRRELWPNDRAWLADEAVGFFQAPRTLPLVLSLIKDKGISGKKDAGSVYLELWARHWGQGIIEIANENEHVTRLRLGIPARAPCGRGESAFTSLKALVSSRSNPFLNEFRIHSKKIANSSSTCQFALATTSSSGISISPLRSGSLSYISPATSKSALSNAYSMPVRRPSAISTKLCIVS